MQTYAFQALVSLITFCNGGYHIGIAYAELNGKLYEGSGKEVSFLPLAASYSYTELRPLSFPISELHKVTPMTDSAASPFRARTPLATATERHRLYERPLPLPKALLGIDYSFNNVGIAVAYTNPLCNSSSDHLYPVSTTLWEAASCMTHPVRILHNDGYPDHMAAKILDLAQDIHAYTLVVGKPVHLSTGKRTTFTSTGWQRRYLLPTLADAQRQAITEANHHFLTAVYEDFCRALSTYAAGHFPKTFEILFFDERYTTKAARERVKALKKTMKGTRPCRLRDVDDVAACILLEKFVSKKGKGAKVVIPGQHRMFHFHRIDKCLKKWNNLQRST